MIPKKTNSPLQASEPRVGQAQRTTEPARSTRAAKPQAPVLRFSPTAWAKLLYFRDCGHTEIGGFGITPVDDPKMMELFRDAMVIWLRELPEVPLVQYFHRIGYNTTYWTNWPTEENPYINGAQRHLTFPILLWNIQPTQ